MDQKETRKNTGFHYGWVVFAACLLMIFVALGFGSSTKSIFLKAATSDAALGISRTEFSLSETFRFIGTAVASLFFGRLVEKFGARKLIGFGFACLTAALLIYSFSQANWHFWVGGAFLGIGFGMSSTTIVGYVVTKWFTNNKGTVMGIALAANGLGGLASEQIVSRIVRGFNLDIAWTETHWRLAYRVISIIFVVTAVIVVTLVRNDPKDMGLEPMGQDAAEKKKRGANWTGYETKEVFRQPFFYLTGVSVFLIGFSLQALGSISRTHMLDVNIDESVVVSIFSVYHLLLVAAKVLSGFTYDRFGIRFNFAFSCVAAIISVTSMAFLNAERLPLAWLYGLIAGFAMPLETVMIPLLVSDLFGSRPYSRVMGYYMALNTLGYACGVPISNLFYDLTVPHTYRPFFIVLIFLFLAATVISQTAIGIALNKRKKILAGTAN